MTLWKSENLQCYLYMQNNKISHYLKTAPGKVIKIAKNGSSVTVMKFKIKKGSGLDFLEMAVEFGTFITSLKYSFLLFLVQKYMERLYFEWIGMKLLINIRSNGFITHKAWILFECVSNNAFGDRLGFLTHFAH